MLRPGKGSNGLPTAYGNNGSNGAGGGTGGGYSYNNGGYGGYGSSSGGGGGFGVSAGYDNGGGIQTSASRKRNGMGSKYSKPGKGGMDIKFIVACIVAGVFFITTLSYRSSATTVLKKLDATSVDDAIKTKERLEREKSRWQREAQSQAENQRRFKDTMRDLETENRKLKTEKTALEQQQATGSVMSKVEAQTLKSREQALVNQVHLLQNATARESRREAVERFGPGPHHIKFDVKFADSETLESFIVELAPLHLMPHAVHLFLEQAYHELWDNTWFYLNGPHVLQAGPQDWDEDPVDKGLKRFKDQQLDTLSFPEYSGEFPHVPWTLGYTGRPGGPDFYINKVDNTVPHGPGGQFQHDLSEQADPCFAKVTDGHDVLMKVFKLQFYPANHEYAYFLNDPVEIVRARIMEPIIPPGFGIGKKNEDGERPRPKQKAPKRPRMIHKENLPKVP